MTTREKLNAAVRTALDWLGRVVTEPRSELTRWQGAVRYAYDLGRQGASQLRRDRAPQMAAALAFRTLFGLLPVLVVGTLIVRALGGHDQFQDAIASFLTSIGLDDLHIGGAGGAAAGTVDSQTLSEWMLALVDQAQNINFGAIAGVGGPVLLYSALSLMVTVESGFNVICHAPGGRSWSRRVPIYWTTLTLAPLVIAATAWLDRSVDGFVERTFGWSWLLRMMPLITSFSATTLVAFVAYKLIPNTIVRTQPALMGAIVAAILLEIGKRTMGVYLSNAVSISQLYGSLGLVPLFMFWVYLMWLVVLFGLEVAIILQMLAGRRPEDFETTTERTGLVDPAAIILVMEVIASRFRAATPVPSREIAEEAGLPEPTVRLMLDRLITGGFLHRLDREDGAVTLARPPETIEAAALIDIGFDMVDGTTSSGFSSAVERLRDAQRAVAGSSTLTDLLSAQKVATTSGQGNGA